MALDIEKDAGVARSTFDGDVGECDQFVEAEGFRKAFQPAARHDPVGVASRASHEVGMASHPRDDRSADFARERIVLADRLGDKRVELGRFH
ncbi:MAG: hypothetical protein GW859_00285 [Sphingomonadales bacterium]|nr:hypothetical protein [Sphingomonadales bacterium]